MTAQATRTRRAPKVPKSRPPQDSSHEAEFRRWTPEEVVEKQLMPYRSVRVLTDKCHRGELFCHTDGGRITFNAEDFRRNAELGARTPAA
ncbi:hypothetical protein ACFVGN_05760 [Streptomyces sp. NPDC057757]|uniref:hypothetical protein n=1 Tax=Streptomyces sp. NPDC057757 TaxID=3346241 RepID=UPI00369D9A9B